MMTRGTVLVSGGAGYIGSHTSKALAAAGWLPVAYDSLITGHAKAVQWGPLEIGDIADAARVAEVIATYKPVAIMHFAASAYVGESMENPLKYYRNNVAGSLTLIEQVIAHRIPHFVFSSSCATYGVSDEGAVTEEKEQNPINPYGHSKLVVEKILQEACRVYEMSCVALRYFNAAGSSEDGEIGEEHDPETHLIPLVLMAARDPSRHITIFGTDYDTRDGTCVRDFIHVEDLADAHVAALERLMTKRLTGFSGINLGTGNGFTIQEIISEVRRLTNRDVRVEKSMRRPGDPGTLVADATKARLLLDWSPRRSKIETIIRSAWNYADRT